MYIQVWRPYRRKDKLKKIQGRATKLIPGLHVVKFNAPEMDGVKEMTQSSVVTHWNDARKCLIGRSEEGWLVESPDVRYDMPNKNSGNEFK